MASIFSSSVQAVGIRRREPVKPDGPTPISHSRVGSIKMEGNQNRKNGMTGGNPMKSTATWILAASLATLLSAQTGASLKHKPVMIKRLYTGPDGQTHLEEIEAKFTASGPSEVFNLMAIAGAELHRVASGTAHEWHIAPRPQYAFTLAGEEEIEVAGGKKIHFGPGDIELAEDTTGKGHFSRSGSAEWLGTLARCAVSGRPQKALATACSMAIPPTVRQ
jgi:hypothetical protein